MNLRIVKRTIDKVVDYLIEYGVPSGYKDNLLWKPLGGPFATLVEAENEIKLRFQPTPEVKTEVVWQTRTGELIPLPSERTAEVSVAR